MQARSHLFNNKQKSPRTIELCRKKLVFIILKGILEGSYRWLSIAIPALAPEDLGQ